ncbi:MAG TPA: tyrosine-type recombinase/integrase [Gemmataceae bacterium]|nr:tyrosine-type recombinase/integrase [Gemmataceae bacterium]
MARVFKKSITRYLDAEGRQVPKGTPGARKVREKSAKWYGRPPGAARPVPLCENKTAAQIMLNELVRKAGLATVGISDPYEEHRKRPLLEHLADFESALLAQGVTAKQAGQVTTRVRRVLAGCGFVFMADLSASRAMEYLATLRDGGRILPPLESGKGEFTLGELAAALGVRPHAVRGLVRRQGLAGCGHGQGRRFPRETAEALRDRLSRGASVQTVNFYLQAVKQFCRWLVKDRRMGESPLAHLQGGNVQTDRRHDRRELNEEELRSLLTATRASQRTFRGLSGPDRFALYATACGTGFRASALASLTPESFDLDADVPTVTLAAQHNKSRKLKVQPLPPDLAKLLRDYLAGRPAGQPVWGRAWTNDNKGAEMLRGDLEAAGIPYVIAGPDGPQYADFHSLRHSFLTLGSRAGIDLRTLQELAGHSTPVLTARYSHRRLYDLAGAVEKLPSFLPGREDGSEAAALRATGTDGRPVPVQLPASCSPVAQTADSECVGLRLAEGEPLEEAERPDDAKPVQRRGLRAAESDCEGLTGVHLTGLEPAAVGCLDRRRRGECGEWPGGESVTTGARGSTSAGADPKISGEKLTAFRTPARIDVASPVLWGCATRPSAHDEGSSGVCSSAMLGPSAPLRLSFGGRRAVTFGADLPVPPRDRLESFLLSPTPLSGRPRFYRFANR